MNPQDSNLVDVTQNFTGLGNSNPMGLAQSANAGQPAQPQQPKANWLERLLPTAGSILGGIAGTFVSPIAGSAAGAGLGGALGQQLENTLTGQKQSTMAAGLENAVGGALGGIGGKVLSAGAGAASKLLSKGAVDSIMGQAPNLLDRNTAEYLVNNGITDLSKIQNIAPKVVGQAGGEGAAFTNGVRNAVDNSTDKVSIVDALQRVQDSLDASPLGGNEKAVASALKKSMFRMTGDSGGDVSLLRPVGSKSQSLDDAMLIFGNSGQRNAMTRGAVYNEATKFQKLASQIEAKAPKDQFGNIASPEQSSMINAYRNYGNALEEKALGLGESDVPLAISKSDKNFLKQQIADLQKQYPQLHGTLINNIDSAQNWKEIRSATKPLVDSNKAFNAISGKLNAKPSTTPLEAVSKGKTGVLSSVLNAPLTKKIETAGTSKLAQTLAPGAIPTTGLQKGLGVTTKDSGLLNKLLPILTRTTAVGAANLPNLAGSAPSTQPANNNQGANMNQQPMGMGGQTQQPITELFKQLLAQEQAGAGLTSNSGNLISALASLAAPAQQTQLLGNLQGGLQQGFANAGGAQGTLGGSLTNLSGILPGTAANQYRRNQSAVGSLLQSLYGIPAGQGAALTPQFTQTPTTAGISAQALGY